MTILGHIIIHSKGLKVDFNKYNYKCECTHLFSRMVEAEARITGLQREGIR